MLMISVLFYFYIKKFLLRKLLFFVNALKRLYRVKMITNSCISIALGPLWLNPGSAPTHMNYVSTK